MAPIITLTTDFGMRDSYVGTMKGVILGICPDARIVDMTHDITPQNILEAVFMLERFIAYFPPETVHVVVVDPGVGSDRRPIAMTTPQARFVGPDNGVFGLVWQQSLARWSAAEVQAVELHNQRFWLPEVSNTFHGRDIFAPVAAHLACGADMQVMGDTLETLIVPAVPQPEWKSGRHVVGEVVFIDHFGNCVTNLGVEHLEQLYVNAGSTILQYIILEVDAPAITTPLLISATYADAEPGEVLSLLGSSGRLEIAVNQGSAHKVAGIEIGTKVGVKAGGWG